MGVPFTKKEGPEEHIDDEAATTEDDVHGHGHRVGECGIVEDGDEVEERDLDEIGRERNLARLETWVGYPNELRGERIEGDEHELDEGD